MIWQSRRLKEIPWLAHGTATRDFGSTRYPNPGEADATAENRARFLCELELDPARLVVSGNVHGNVLVDLTLDPLLSKERGAPGSLPLGKVEVQEGVSVRRVENCDGLITSECGFVLATKTADCLPLFYVDPATRTVAIAHAGWKGVAAGIAIEAVRAFLTRGSRPQDLLVAIGPSIARVTTRSRQNGARTCSRGPRSF